MLFSLVAYSSVATFIHFLLFLCPRSTECQSSLSVPHFWNQMDHHYLPYHPRRVKREMKKRLIVFYACQLKAYLTHLDKRKLKKCPNGNRSLMFSLVKKRQVHLRLGQMCLIWANSWSLVLINNWEGDKQHPNVSRWVNVDSQEEKERKFNAFSLLEASQDDIDINHTNKRKRHRLKTNSTYIEMNGYVQARFLHSNSIRLFALLQLQTSLLIDVHRRTNELNR